MRLNLILYFFSNFYLLVFGLIFILPLFFDSKKSYDSVKKLIYGNRIHNYAGMFGLPLGLLLVFFPMANLKTNKTVMVFGDLIPSVLIGLIAITLIFGFVRKSKIIDEQTAKKVDSILISFQVPIGLASIACGIVHVIVPDFMFF